LPLEQLEQHPRRPRWAVAAVFVAVALRALPVEHLGEAVAAAGVHGLSVGARVNRTAA
jgi:hypothetical protein